MPVAFRIAYIGWPASMPPCRAPLLDFWFDFASTYSYPAAMRIGPLAGKPASRCAFARSCSGRSSRRRAGPPRRSISTRPRAATCGATSSGCAPTWRCRSGGPIRFRRTACWRRASRWPGLDDGWGEDFCRAVFRAEFGDGRRIDDAGDHRRHPRGTCRSTAAGARSRAVGRDQGAAAGADRGGAAARHLRRAELRDRRRRTVLGQRPARAGAALGAERLVAG